MTPAEMHLELEKEQEAIVGPPFPHPQVVLEERGRGIGLLITRLYRSTD
jgi:hypothetical protein